MCATCGCSGHEVEIGSHQDVANSRHHEHHEDQDGGTRCASKSHVDLRGQEGVRIVKLAANVLKENVKYAEQTRRYLRERAVRMLNLVSAQVPERQHCSLGQLEI